MHYFDWTATTPMSRHAIEVYAQTAQTITGNPSSTHPLGIQAKIHLEEQRKTVSEILSTKKSYIYFTGGGTESDSIVLSSLLNSPSPGQVITSAIEHSAIMEYRRVLESKGWVFTALRCPRGYLDPEDLKAALTEKTRLVTFMKINNVTGTILDTKALVKTVRDYEKTSGRKVHIHCDAVQALGKIPFFPEKEDFDSAAFSAHKFCGPRGIGILYCRSKAIAGLSRGGGQEAGLRPGTENVPAISAMVAALQDAIEEQEMIYRRVSDFRDRIEHTARDNGYTILSTTKDEGVQYHREYSPYIINISARPIPSEVFLRVMADKGFCLSAGSACSANARGKAESVLSAMNIDHNDRKSSIRISMGAGTTEEDVSSLCRALMEARMELGNAKK